MQKNRLHEIVDQVKNNKLLAFNEFFKNNDHKPFEICIDFFKKHAPQAICFYSPIESFEDIKIQHELIMLPYPTTWIEMHSEERFGFGFLCNQTLDGIEVLIFYCDEEQKFEMASSVFIDKNCECKYLLGLQNEAVARSVGGLAQILTAINCCNIKRTEHKPKPSQQSVRRALGRQPLFSTWTLEIDLQRTKQEMPSHGGTHASPRLHLRRGHAREYKPGVWCWVQPHVVGDKSIGIIHKDYQTKGNQYAKS